MVNCLPSGGVLLHFLLGSERFEASFFCAPFVFKGIVCTSMYTGVAILEGVEIIAISLGLILLSNGTQLVVQTLVLGPDVFHLTESLL